MIGMQIELDMIGMNFKELPFWLLYVPFWNMDFLYTAVLLQLTCRNEREQLSAAHVITGLCNSCPNDMLFEADLQPLSLRRNSCPVKYYNKLYSYGSKNRTSDLLQHWHSNERLKKRSPLSQKQCIDPSVGLPGSIPY
ncbi:reverse transcriptase domain-containing protein [Trichonephila clavipes]|nr:reverse transcriptase domain-containing protein [Trichonephila clavipes]